MCEGGEERFIQIRRDLNLYLLIFQEYEINPNGAP
jgi:hypothetical protein